VLAGVGSALSAGHDLTETQAYPNDCDQGLNTTELIAVRCLNPLCQPSFCDESHSAATKNLDWLRAIAVVIMRELLSSTTEHLCNYLWRGGMADMHRKLKLRTNENVVDVLRHVFECLLAAS
jgi:hypothetical protein